MKYVRSPIFYMGNKLKLLPDIMPLFPKDINTFYDLFGGSGVVSANANARQYVYNEANANIVNIYKLFRKYTPEELDTRIRSYIKEYDLNTEGTDVRCSNPAIKDIRSYYNKNYIKFREAYNKSERDYLMLYTLTFYSFSNIIRFNSNSEFNAAFGNRCYCDKHYNEMVDWYNLIKDKFIIVSNDDAFKILELYLNGDGMKQNTNDFFYFDPPYSNTLAVYNEKRAFGGWSIEDDYKLFNYLERLNSIGIKWGLSNVFVNKGHENTHLIEWCEKNNWYVHHINHSYSSLGKGNAHSDEVYICNYEVEVNNE